MVRFTEIFAQRPILPALVSFLFISAVYLFAFPQPNVVYPAIVLLHAIAGFLGLFFCVTALIKCLRSRSLGSIAWVLMIAGGLVGLVLIYTGTPRSTWSTLYTHIVLCTAAVGVLLAQWAQRRGWLGKGIAPTLVRVTASFVVLAILGGACWYQRTATWQKNSVIQNPSDSPESMAQEGDGPNGNFFPSSAQVYGNQKIPSEFFMQSDSCKRCHEDIYNQWYSSVHHFSSFNNQWYRKSIEYMQDTIGTKPSKWCGGCHDPAVLYAGKMDRPIKEFVHAPEAQAGLGCMMCHSIARVKSTMGQGDFYLEYPKLHEMAASKNPVVRGLHDFLVKLNPEPHRRVFLKPFMRNQTAQFCSACHKVHLDVPVNSYRWIRGFNEYDNWQASGVSGEGARSFYYPPKSSQCADCHMPMMQSKDMGNIDGYVHSHRFAAANTAVPTANQDEEQLQAVKNFLQNGVMSIDIFAMSPDGPEKKAAIAQNELSTTFAVGEEAEAKVEPGQGGESRTITAPLNRVQPVVRRGDTMRVDVVVRTKKLGHFFPGGTVDAYDTWVELKGTDDKGQTLFWSGMVEDDGKGPVEPGAHFYKSLQIDEHGNPINKRNAWATRSVVYVHLIPPGAADTVHYRLRIPENAGSKITLHARLCYRKFTWWNTQFAFAGVPDTSSSAVARSYDDRAVSFKGSLNGVSAKEEKIPDVPIIPMAEDEVTLAVAPHGAPVPQPKLDVQKTEWQRWNDYGIGLLAQGDLKGAAAAFEKITDVDPQNPDGWVNMGRVAVQEGDMDRARTVLEKALQIKPDLARANFFYAKVLRADGNYQGAADHLHKVVAQYPRDRVALNDLGRILFLQRKYQEAINTLQGVLAVDPEDLQAHYNLMLCYNGLGDEKQAHDHQFRYLRFKADEAAQAITGPYREKHPEDNNERQAIHEHDSVSLQVLSRKSNHSGNTADRAPINKPARSDVRSSSFSRRSSGASQ